MLEILALGLTWCAILPSASPDTGQYDTLHPAVKATNIRHLETLDDAKLKRLIRVRHGKALFINVWATWCEPCVEEFPDIVKLANEMKGKDIDFVGVSGDDPEDETSKVIPFIASEKAHFKFYLAKLEGEDEFINTFDKEWGGGIPATFVYDAQGTLEALLVGKQSYQKLKNASEKALAKKGRHVLQ